MDTSLSRTNHPDYRAELFGGISGAIAVLPQTIGLSVLLFTSIGMDPSAGAMAGLIGAIILLLCSGIAGATTGMISAPNGPVTILLSGLVVQLLPDYNIQQVILILGAVLFFTGVFQVLFGLLKGGEIIKLIPYPVVASMITAIGILMIKSQFTQILPDMAHQGWPRYIPLTVACMTVTSIFISKSFFPRLPEILMGLICGILVYSALLYFLESTKRSWVIGTLPTLDFSSLFQRFDNVHNLELPWQLILSSALALAILVMIDSLLTALVADTQTSMRHDARKELVAQGIGQMIIGLIGGVGGGGTKGSTLANTMAGGRRWSPLVAAAVILGMTIFGRELGTFLPISALSGVIIYIGIKMININILLWFKEKYTRIDAVNGILVIGTTLIFGVTKAVALGVAFAIITFIRRGMKRSLIRRETTVFEYPSPRKRGGKQAEVIKKHGDKALLIELQGNLYFARTDQLYRHIMKKVDGRSVIILHFRRVLSIDMSGMVVLMQLVEAAKKNGTEIVFTHLHRQLGFGRKMKRAFNLIESQQKSIAKIFKSTARALEYAENQILLGKQQGEKLTDISSVPFEENNLCKDISSQDILVLQKLSEKKQFMNKETVLAEGDTSSSLYLVTSGFVEQRLYNGPTSYKVLAKFSPGTYFGKLAFFNLGPVSTRFVAQGDTILFKIKRSDIEQEAHKAANSFFTNILFAMGKNLAQESERYISEISRLEAL